MDTVIDVSEFEQFFREQYGSLVSLGTWLTNDRSTGEDLAQEALRVAHQRWDTVGSYERPGAFCRRTLINLAGNERRRRGREERALERVAARPVTTAALPTDAATDPLWAQVADLPLKQRAAIGLRYLDDLPAARIAEILGCSEATVRVHLHRGHRRLAERLTLRWEHPHEPSTTETNP